MCAACVRCPLRGGWRGGGGSVSTGMGRQSRGGTASARRKAREQPMWTQIGPKRRRCRAAAAAPGGEPNGTARRHAQRNPCKCRCIHSAAASTHNARAQSDAAIETSPQAQGCRKGNALAAPPQPAATQLRYAKHGSAATRVHPPLSQEPARSPSKRRHHSLDVQARRMLACARRHGARGTCRGRRGV